MFRFDAAVRAIDPPHRVDQKHLQAKNWHELKPTWFACIVGRPWLAAAAAPRPTVLARNHINLDFPLAAGIVLDKLRAGVNKALEFVLAVEDSS